MFALLFLPALVSQVLGDAGCIQKADFVFVIDSSSSIWDPNFNKQISFVKQFVQRFDIRPDETRVAALTFGENVHDEFYLNTYGNADDILTAISHIKHAHGNYTRTHDALRAVAERFFTVENGARPNVAHVAIVLTDGKSSLPDETLAEAGRVKGLNIFLFGVGIGKDVGAEELGKMVTQPPEEYRFLLKTFEELKSETFQRILEKRTCEIITTPKPTPTEEIKNPGEQPEPDCQGKAADVVFVLDKSSSIDTEETFNLQRQFVKDVVNEFDIDSRKTQVGLISFSTTAQIEFPLNRYSNKANLFQAIQNVQFTGGNTNTGYALQLMLDQMYSNRDGARSGIAKIAIVITDGLSQQPLITKAEAEKAHARGIYTFAIGVGPSVDLKELEAIASKPTKEYMHTVNSYAALYTVKNLLAYKACSGTKTPAIPPIYIPAPQSPCEQNPVDLVFVLDKSSSIYKKNFEKQMNFVNDIIDMLEINPGKSRVAIVTFSNTSKVEFNLDTYYNKMSLKNAVLGVEYTGGFTNTWLGLQTLVDNIYVNQRRPGIPFVAIVITDGMSQEPRLTAMYAGFVHAKQIRTFAIGVGDQIDKNELAAIASRPSSTYVYNVDDYASLSSIEDAIVKETCRGTKTPAIPPIYIPAPQSPCEQNPVDLVFVLDKSSSIYQKNFEKQMNFVNDIIDMLEINPGKSRVAIVTFSNTSKVEFNLDTYYNKMSLKNAVLGIEYTGGFTNTWLGLQTLVDNIYVNQRRPGIPFVAIVITDGMSQEPRLTAMYAGFVHAKQIRTFAIGVGDQIDKNELAAIASRPSSTYVYNVDDYASLSSIEDAIVKETCRGTKTPAIPPIYIPAPQSPCEQNPVDLVFVLDKSSSIYKKNFEKQMNFVNDIIDMLEINPGKSRVAIVTFSNTSKVEFNLDTYYNKMSLKNAVLGVEYTGGFTNTWLGLQTLVDNIYVNQRRPGIPFVAIVITDGMSQEPRLTAMYAGFVHAKQIRTFAIGVGDQIDKNELAAIASRPIYVYNVDDYASLSSIEDAIVKETCREIRV